MPSVHAKHCLQAASGCPVSSGAHQFWDAHVPRSSDETAGSSGRKRQEPPVRASQHLEASGPARRDENSADSDVEDMDTLHAPQQVGQYIVAQAVFQFCHPVQQGPCAQAYGNYRSCKQPPEHPRQLAFSLVSSRPQ